ncbi:hypothetical protein PaG_01796 [Moesziomyces aphidis]|uniref:RRM domain-containing protein n=1 Tax=Moesziomyces aphidis TaxID=84754 RepID=W3VPT5_MOEAP|nr:hypothetical protein PaG_01796 [Moesziomyces aphidis]
MRPDRDRALRNLYVLNLPLDATTDHFEALFSRYGHVEHAVILATLDHLARRRGFILMSSPDEARAAIENLNGHSWHRYRIEVSFAIVQRSGTPFPHEAQDAVEPPRRPKLPQQVSSELQACGPSFASASFRLNRADSHFLIHTQSRESSQPTDTPVSAPHSEQPLREAGQSFQQGEHEAVLKLSGLDTAVFPSSDAVRALTEPFGNVQYLLHSAQCHPSSIASQAFVVYCCRSSASLARLALDNFAIGNGRITASLASPAALGDLPFHTDPCAPPTDRSASQFHNHPHGPWQADSRAVDPGLNQPQNRMDAPSEEKVSAVSARIRDFVRTIVVAAH